MKKIFFVLIVCVFVFCGCTGAAEETEKNQEGPVMQISVERLPTSGEVYRTYHTDGKIQTVLNYFNDLPLKKSEPIQEEDPEGSWKITYHYANGSSKIFCWVDGEYLRTGDGKCFTLEEIPQSTFEQILSENESEEQISHGEPASLEVGGENKIPQD